MRTSTLSFRDTSIRIAHLLPRCTALAGSKRAENRPLATTAHVPFPGGACAARFAVAPARLPARDAIRSRVCFAGDGVEATRRRGLRSIARPDATAARGRFPWL